MYNPHFTITPKINSQIAEIEGLRTLVDHAAILPELEVQLRFRATIEAVHSSTSIEGNPLNEQQVRKVLQGEVVTAPNYAIIEVLNYKQALDWMNERQTSKKVLTATDILDLHKIITSRLLPKEKSGHWRPGDVFVIDEVDGEEIVQYIGPEAKHVPQLVTSFLQWVVLQRNSTTLHPVLLSGLIHYIFVSIHPFSDGNGRTTRLLTQYYLKSWNYDFRGSLSLDSFYLQNRPEYFAALSRGKTFEERMSADITPFLEFFTEGFLEVATTLNQYLKVGRVTDETRPMRLSADELAILDFIYQFGSISTKEAIAVLSLPKRTIQRRLMELVQKDILTVAGQGPSVRYHLNATIR